MLYRTFPKIQDKPISVLGFGLMRLPKTLSGELDYALIKELIATAVESGINYFDTAYPYHDGASETVLGNALCELGLRDKVYIADKMPVWLVREKADFQTIFEAQLERLKTDRIDFYLVHALNRGRWEAMKNLGIIGFLQDLKKKGKICHIGFSFHDTFDAFTRIIDEYPDWEFCQLQYNYLDEDAQAGVKGIGYAAARGIGTIVMEGLRGGLLAHPPKAVLDIFAAADKPRMPAEWALRWVWENQNVVCALSGMNSAYQLTMNVASAAAAKPNSLPRAQLEVVQKAAAWFKPRIKVPCTQCDYCIPCPHNVRISTIFAEWNTMSLLGRYEETAKGTAQANAACAADSNGTAAEKEAAQVTAACAADSNGTAAEKEPAQATAAAHGESCTAHDSSGGIHGESGGTKALSSVYRALVKEKADASWCVKCRVCEQKCPQHIPIASMLEKAHNAFE